MGGIAGIVYTNAPGDALDIRLMTDAVAHRGPDGEGYIAVSAVTGVITELGGEKTPACLPPLSGFGGKAGVYLGHRRLCLTGSEVAGHQPMPNGRKNAWVIYDGEIYNHKSLRNELREFDFVSGSDTETLLHAYGKWGADCLRRFNGVWSFVVYDAVKNILFGARDRFGSKPLYYTQAPGFFAFNSEIKGLLAKPEVSRRVNADASTAYLRTGLESFGGETFFESVTELQPAHCFTYDLEKKKLSVERYYELPFCDTWESFDEKKSSEYIDGVKTRILRAVDLRLEASVPAGSCLSGGIDSSAIVCAVDKLLGEKKHGSTGPGQKVITACYEDSLIDESGWAKCVADHVSAEWHRVFPKREELVEDLSDLVYSQDVPFGSTSIYAQYRVVKAAKELGLKVVLDGQGGDEVFTGYAPYYNMFYSEAGKNGETDLLAAEQKHVKNTPFGDIDINKLSQKHIVKETVKKYLPQKVKKFLRTVIRQPELKYIRFSGKPYKQHSYTTLNQMLWVFMSYITLPQNLRWADRCFMWHSIGYRAPFADDIDLIEYVFQIPGVYKIHNGWSKYLLRESMGSLMPKQVKERTDKIGFATPEYDWLRSIKPYVFDGVGSDINGILKISRMEKDWEKMFAGQNKNGATDIWRYINFILWFKTFRGIL